MVPELKLRILHLPGRSYASELHHQPYMYFKELKLVNFDCSVFYIALLSYSKVKFSD